MCWSNHWQWKHVRGLTNQQEKTNLFFTFSTMMCSMRTCKSKSLIVLEICHVMPHCCNWLHAKSVRKIIRLCALDDQVKPKSTFCRSKQTFSSLAMQNCPVHHCNRKWKLWAIEALTLLRRQIFSCCCSFAAKCKLFVQFDVIFATLQPHLWPPKKNQCLQLPSVAKGNIVKFANCGQTRRHVLLAGQIKNQAIVFCHFWLQQHANLVVLFTS